MKTIFTCESSKKNRNPNWPGQLMIWRNHRAPLHHGHSYTSYLSFPITIYNTWTINDHSSRSTNWRNILALYDIVCLIPACEKSSPTSFRYVEPSDNQLPIFCILQQMMQDLLKRTLWVLAFHLLPHPH